MDRGAGGAGADASEEGGDAVPAVYLPAGAVVVAAGGAGGDDCGAALAGFFASPPMCRAASSAAVAEVEPAGTVDGVIAAGFVIAGADGLAFFALAPPLATAAYDRTPLNPLDTGATAADAALVGATTGAAVGAGVLDTMWICGAWPLLDDWARRNAARLYFTCGRGGSPPGVAPRLLLPLMMSLVRIFFF